MIKRIFDLSSEVKSFFHSYPIKTVAISALSETYDLNGTVLALYVQTTDDNETVTAVAGIYGDGAQIALSESSDIDEIAQLIAFLNVNTVIINSEDRSLLEKVTGYEVKKASLLALKAPFLVPANDSICPYPRLSDVYGILCRFFDMSDRDTFIAEMQARINHGTGKAIAATENGEISAVACIFFESGHCGFLGGVATNEKHRRKGYASLLVSQLCRELLNKSKLPLISCVNPAAKKVYMSLGFVEIGENITLVRRIEE